MSDRRKPGLTASDDLSEIVRKIRPRTPARLLVGRAGAAYPTRTQLELREAHAAARDAVRAELELGVLFGADFIQEWNLFEVRTRVTTKDEYLLRPDLGRHFDSASVTELRRRSVLNVDLQIAIGDGLSIPAIAAQVPALLPVLCAGAAARGWSQGRTPVIRHCRVGILNEIGEILNPRVAVLLIGERPGLATAESLSAYMAYRPNRAHSDADRNLISNIQARGIGSEAAATRILHLAEQMIKAGASGYLLRERGPDA
jgi:ethanolamine ammonia-lyase small subunit